MLSRTSKVFQVGGRGRWCEQSTCLKNKTELSGLQSVFSEESKPSICQGFVRKRRHWRTVNN